MTKHNTTLYNQIYVTFNKIFVTFMTDAFSIKLLMWNSENFKVVQPVQTCRESFFFDLEFNFNSQSHLVNKSVGKFRKQFLTF